MFFHNNESNFSSRIYQEYRARLHRNRLEQIKHRPKLTLHNSLDPRPPDTKRPSRFLSVAKFKEIRRENQLIYDRLTSIAVRKQTAYPSSKDSSPRTLNHVHRKRESDRIARENQDLLRRIIEKPSNFSIERLREEYGLKQKYKENLSKKRTLDRIDQLVRSHPMTVLTEGLPKRMSVSDSKQLVLEKKADAAVLRQLLHDKRSLNDEGAIISKPPFQSLALSGSFNSLPLLPTINPS
jgi:hypothetical protein